MSVPLVFAPLCFDTLQILTKKLTAILCQSKDAIHTPSHKAQLFFNKPFQLQDSVLLQKPEYTNITKRSQGPRSESARRFDSKHLKIEWKEHIYKAEKLDRIRISETVI